MEKEEEEENSIVHGVTTILTKPRGAYINTRENCVLHEDHRSADVAPVVGSVIVTEGRDSSLP